MNKETTKTGDLKQREIVVYDWIPKDKPKGWRKWMGKVATDGEDIYVSSQIGGVSQLAAMISGAPCIHVDGQLLVPMKWLERERPDRVAFLTEIRGKIEAKLRDHERTEATKGT